METAITTPIQIQPTKGPGDEPDPPQNVVDIEMEQLRLARIDEDFTRTELKSVEELRDAFLQNTAEGRHIVQKMNDLIEAKELAKTVTKTRYEAVRDTILIKAKVAISKGQAPWGRGIHINAHVQQGSELNVIDMPKAVAWLELVGMAEIVSIPLRGNTGFFKNAKPPVGTLELVTIPTVKIDKEIKVGSLASLEKVSIPTAGGGMNPYSILPTDGDIAALSTAGDDLIKAAEKLVVPPSRAEIKEADQKKDVDTSDIREALGGGKDRRV